MIAMIVDAENVILGRMASEVSQRLLTGQNIDIINCEKCVVSGNRKSIFSRFEQKHAMKSKVSPRRIGPHYPRTPDGIVKRAIRGMLPRKTTRGKSAFGKLRVHVGHPPELKEETTADLNLKTTSGLNSLKYVTVAEISEYLGGYKP